MLESFFQKREKLEQKSEQCAAAKSDWKSQTDTVRMILSEGVSDPAVENAAVMELQRILQLSDSLTAETESLQSELKDALLQLKRLGVSSEILSTSPKASIIGNFQIEFSDSWLKVLATRMSETRLENHDIVVTDKHGREVRVREEGAALGELADVPAPDRFPLKSGGRMLPVHPPWRITRRGPFSLRSAWAAPRRTTWSGYR